MPTKRKKRNPVGNIHRNISLKEAEKVLALHGFEKMIEEVVYRAHGTRGKETPLFQLWFREPAIFFSIETSSFHEKVDSGRMHLQVAYRKNPDEASADDISLLGRGGSSPMFKEVELKPNREGELVPHDNFDTYYGRALNWHYNNALDALQEVEESLDTLEILKKWDPWVKDGFFLNDGGAYYQDGVKRRQETLEGWMQKNYDLAEEHDIRLVDFQRGRRLLMLPERIQHVLLHSQLADEIVREYQRGVGRGVRDGRREHPGEESINRALAYIEKEGVLSKAGAVPEKMKRKL